MRGKRWIPLILLLSLLLLAAAARCEDFEPLAVGARSDRVRTIKERLGALGYYRTDTFTRQYTEDTAEKIAVFQRNSGLPETGVVDAATYAALFSDTAQRAIPPTMKPLATPAPLPEPDWPQRDEMGYLAGDGAYFYENAQDGLWAYLSADLQITIVRRQDSRVSLEWFETEIRTRNGEALRAAVTDPDHPGRSALHPEEFARQEGFVLAFSDDFYGNRFNRKETVGVIVRNGRTLSQKTNQRTGTHLPNLDMMAQFPDGSLRVYDCNEATADELLAQGAINVYCFGPWLIRDGEINELVYENFKSIEPRHALGMIEPGHYFLLSVEGRCKASEGTTLQRMAEVMRERGVTQALNLDGGNTMALVFNGKMLNHLAVYDGRRFVRTMTSMIGVGRTP